MRFCPIASGSSGNSIYIGTKSTHILLDVGITGKRLEAGLLSIGAKPPDAIFVTHEHSDHISGVGVISRRFDVPIYATEKTWLRIERHNMIGKIPPGNRRIVYAGEPCVINDLSICAFDIPHDSAQPVGYTVLGEGYKVAVVTDLGYVSDTVRENLAGSDLILLECNHDLEMLENGPYPRDLKDRVRSKKGHLSNVSCAEFLAEAFTPKLKYVYLGHLSEENNRPLLAIDTVLRVLESRKIKVGVELKLRLAERDMPSMAVELC